MEKPITIPIKILISLISTFLILSDHSSAGIITGFKVRGIRGPNFLSVWIETQVKGFGLDSGKHAATLPKGEVGVLHGAMSYLLQDEDGQIIEAHSISAGMDYLGVGPEHSFLKDLGRAEYYSITDEEVLQGMITCDADK